MESVLQLEPTDETRSELATIRSNTETLIKQLNSYRLSQFKNKEKLFELHLEDDFPFSNSTLPITYQQFIARENAWFWSQAIYKFMKRQDSGVFSHQPLTTTDKAPPHYNSVNPDQEFIRVKPSDLEITDATLSVKRPFDSPLEFRITDELQTIESDKVYNIHYTDDPIVITETDDSIFDSQERYITEVETTRKKEIAISYTYMLASGGIEILPIKTPKSEELVQLFNTLNLHYLYVTEVEDGLIFLVSRSESGFERCKAFINDSEREYEDLFTLLGFPKSIFAEYYSQDGEILDYQFDRYSCEEFVVYEFLLNNISKPELQNFIFTPYRPPTTTEEIKYACQLGLQISDSIDTLPHINDYDEITQTVVEHAKILFAMSSKRPLPTPVTPIISAKLAENRFEWNN